jgi:geranylgeranyl pyrophosphate synthase
MGRFDSMTSTTEVELHLADTRDMVNHWLDKWAEYVAREIEDPLGAAMAYSLSSPGKRLRPALVLAAYREMGGEGDASELATAVEVIHTYSLVHDDLPCMDNDDMRRGRPTTHVQFDVPTATEAGFRMVPLSAQVLAAGTERLGLDPALHGRIGVELYRAAGAGGMIRGQVLDLEAEGRDISLDELIDLHQAKTGALITASVVIGALAARADQPPVEALRRFGAEIGLAFQIVDDVLDATGTSAELGKTAGKDAKQQKANFVSTLGVEGARQAAQDRYRRAVDHLGPVHVDCTLLKGLAEYVITRTA